MSNVANISSFAFIIVVFIKSIDVFLSNPDINNLSSIFIAIWLLFLASGPDPIPSLIAIRYFPSFNLICNMLSPETGLPFFIFESCPICNKYLSDDI